MSAGAALYVMLTLWLEARALFFPYTLDYGEGIVVWFTYKLAHGMNIYTTLASSPPFDSANYPPVAMLLTAGWYSIFGDALIFGRWLNFASALLIAAFLVRLVRVETKNTRAAFLAAGLFLGSTFVYHWVPLYRVDLIGVAFCFAGIFFIWKWEQGFKSQVAGDRSFAPLNLGLGACFFLLALYTKHSLFWAPASAVLAVFTRDKRAGIFLAVLLGAIGGALFLLLEILTRGGWSFGILQMNATVWTLRVFLPLMQSFVITHAIVLIFAAYGWWMRVREKRFGVLEIYFVASLASLALAGREGAWENYFFEAVGMACVFTGIAVASFAKIWRRTFAVPVLLLIQLALFWNEHDPRIAQNLFDEVRAGNERVAPLIAKANGTILAEDMGLLWSNGKPVAYYSFPYSTLARAGRYDQKWETENLRAGNFPLVILNRGTREDVDRFGNFTRAFVSALDYGYAVSSQDSHYVVYAPAPLESFEPHAKFADTFELVGWSLEPKELHAGTEMLLTVVWRAIQKPHARYTTFAHLESANGDKLAQDDHEPLNGIYPTTRWADEEMVRDTYRLHLPPAIPNGEYFLSVGWYDSLTQDRLNTSDGRDASELQKFQTK